MRLFRIVLLCCVICSSILAIFPGSVAQAAAVTYYVDCSAGNDAYTGMAPTAAWRTFTKANAALLNPGDSLRLKQGCSWLNTTLIISRSGTATLPILVSSYGTGTLPIIKNSTMGKRDVSVRGSYIILENLYATASAPAIEPGCANAAKGDLMGFVFETGSHNNILRKSQASSLYAGVFVAPGSYSNQIVDSQFINNNMMYPLDKTAYNDAGAFGVLLQGDSNLVSRNFFSGQYACSYDYVQDGAAVEIYGGQRNVISRNKAQNNDTFTELGNSRSAYNTYVYNIVKSTLAQSTFLVTRGVTGFGPVAYTTAFNNSVYLTGAKSIGVVCLACASNILNLKNNILWAYSKSLYATAAFNEGYNIYWRTGGSPVVQGPITATSLKVNPLFTSPDQFNFYLAATSPARNRGTAESANAGYKIDYPGTSVPRGTRVDIGAYEFVE